MLSINKNATHIALKWATLLFIFGSLFIYATDLLLDQYLNDFSFYSTYQTYKGIGFCGIIALILFFTVRHFLLRISKEENDLDRERRFSERIQNSIPGIFFVIDENGQIIKWNENTKEVSGLSDNELNKLYAIERVEEENQKKAQQALEKVLRKGEVQANLLLKTKYEEKTLFKVTANRFQNNGNYFVVGTGIDITEEYKLKEKLANILEKERKKRKKVEIDIKNLKETLDQTPTPRCILEGPEHVYTYANEAYKTVVGKDDLIGEKIMDVIPEVKEQGYIEMLDNVYQTGESYVSNNQSVRIHKSDNEAQQEYIFNLIYEPLRDDNNEIYGIYAEGVDISEQIKANKQIKQQNYQLKAAQEIAQLGYWENDLTTEELVWSDIVYDLFGLNKENYTPKIDNFLDLVHPADRNALQQNIEKLKKDNVFESQYRLIKPSGEVGWFHEIGEVYEWENGEPKILHGIVLDITEQKNQEKRIRKSHIQGENKERKRISNELHDGIAQYLSAALLHLDNTEDYLDVNRGLNQLRNARTLVKRAATETRTISKNLMPQTIEKHGLVVAIKSLIEQYRLSTDIKFSLNINIEDSFPYDNEIETNIYRIIQELLSNAVKHSNCNHIDIQISEQENQLICIVKDDGKGAKTDDITGTDGLGLQSIKNRVELSSGTIEFNNKPSKGLSINIIIPLK